VHLSHQADDGNDVMAVRMETMSCR